MTEPRHQIDGAQPDTPNHGTSHALDRWSTAGPLGALTALLGILAFRVYLALHGLREIDLWNHARPPFGSPQPGATEFVGLGVVVSYIGLSLGSASLICCLSVVVRALRRRDRRSVVLAACSALSAAVGIVLAAQLGCTIAGA